MLDGAEVGLSASSGPTLSSGRECVCLQDPWWLGPRGGQASPVSLRNDAGLKHWAQVCGQWRGIVFDTVEVGSPRGERLA